MKASVGGSESLSVDHRVLLLREEVGSCVRCPLAQTRTMTVFGEGDLDAQILFVGEGPGREEDLTGRPFVGRSGRLLRSLIEELLPHDSFRVYIANVVKCRPPENRAPKRIEVASCRTFLDRQFDLVMPRLVVTLGGSATRAVTGLQAPIASLRGRVHHASGRSVIVTFHPAAALRGGESVRSKLREDLVYVRNFLSEEEG